MANSPKPNVDIQLDELERAYIAGFFDGEGTIGIRQHGRTFKRNREYWECNVAVVNTDECIIRWLQSKIGGNIYRAKRGNAKWKDTFQLKLRAHEVRTLLPMLIPYLRIKRLQAEVVMNFLFHQQAYHSPGVKGHSDNIVQLRRDLYGIARVMNQKGDANGTA